MEAPPAHLSDDVHESVAALEQLRQTHRAPARPPCKELLDDEAEAVGGLVTEHVGGRHAHPHRLRLGLGEGRIEVAHAVLHQRPLRHLVMVGGGDGRCALEVCVGGGMGGVNGKCVCVGGVHESCAREL